MRKQNETSRSQLDAIEDDLITAITVMDAIFQTVLVIDDTNEPTQTNQNLQNTLDEIKVKIHSMVEVLALDSYENINNLYRHIAHAAVSIESEYPESKTYVENLDSYLAQLHSIKNYAKPN
ncbi:hypothetical protein ACON3F_17660 [Providencia hangzhouensis]|uniref:hypothetical protein n=1 Tax=Providencia hangzhouensis TaxID=3031799 RepID=UPI0030CC7DF9